MNARMTGFDVHLQERCRRLTVRTAVPYDYFIGDRLLSNEFRDFLLSRKYSEAVVVADSNLAGGIGGEVAAAVRDYGRLRCQLVSFPAGERHKTLDTVSMLLGEFAKFGLTRSGVVIAAGGGVTGDVSGFAAAVWLRGVPVIQFPTTLVAMIDSSIGGKTGVDLPEGKNLVGAFHQPSAVFAEARAVNSLSRQDLANGFAEMVKTAMIGDAELFGHLRMQPQDMVCGGIILRCAQIKAGIVAEDPQEHGNRRLLNLGHTAGHAIEQVSGYAIPHGEAVATGLAMVARAGVAAGITDEPYCREVLRLLSSSGFAVRPPYPLEQLIPVMHGDKKCAGDRITLVVPQVPGRCVLHTIPVEGLPAFWAGGAASEDCATP